MMFNFRWETRIVVLLVLATLVSVRVLTLMFMRAHLDDPAWFQTGSYARFDRLASDILDGQRMFLIDDPRRTDLAQYPPLFPASVAAIYALTGERSAYVVQLVQWTIDLLLSLVLIGGITVTAFGWRAGIAAGFLVALSPLFAMYSAYPSPDIPAMWFVLAGNWLLLLAGRRNNVWLAVAAGALLGIACWVRVNPLYLAIAWGIVPLIVAKAPWRRRLAMSGAVVFATAIVISPIVVRNYLTFPDFTLTGGTIGGNIWEGLGETDRGRQHGFVLGDDKLVEHERVKLGLPAEAPFDLQWPDGIRRENERARESMAFIAQHPVWYVGVMARRMWGMLKVAGDPVPYSGIAGFNVTSRKCLPPAWQGGVVAFGVNVLGMIQSVARYLFLPLAAFGIYVAARRDKIATAILLVTILYYLVPSSVGHTEIRYVLPMHALLTVFAAAAVDRILQRR